jgi:hypothetical protein
MPNALAKLVSVVKTKSGVKRRSLSFPRPRGSDTIPIARLQLLHNRIADGLSEDGTIAFLRTVEVERKPMPAEELPDNKNPARRRWLSILGIAAACFIVVAMLSAWWIKSNLYASPFSPTTLTEREQQALNAKLDRLQRNIPTDPKSPPVRTAETKSEGPLAPEPYTEDAARRELRITEKN